PAPRAAGTAWDRGDAVRAALLNPARPVVTRILLALNLVWFLVGLWLASRHNATGPYLSFAGGDQKVNEIRHKLGTLHIDDIVQNGEWWRLISYSFVHLGFIHLAMNMYVLYAIGSMVEVFWGSFRYLVLYLTAALVGGAFQLLIDPRVGVGGAS